MSGQFRDALSLLGLEHDGDEDSIPYWAERPAPPAPPPPPQPPVAVRRLHCADAAERRRALADPQKRAIAMKAFLGIDAFAAA